MTIHASAVEVAGKGLLILGPSGSGKSSLALQMMALGARLIADDRVVLTRDGDAIIADCPPRIAGLIEARGIGLRRAEPAGRSRVALAVDLGEDEPDRLPPPRFTTLHGVRIPLVLGPLGPHLGVSLRQLMIFGRSM